MCTSSTVTGFGWTASATTGTGRTSRSASIARGAVGATATCTSACYTKSAPINGHATGTATRAAEAAKPAVCTTTTTGVTGTYGSVYTAAKQLATSGAAADAT